jgi:hypothetical protein
MKRLSFDVDDETYRRLMAEYEEIIEVFETSKKEYAFKQYLAETMAQCMKTDEEEKEDTDLIMDVIEHSPRGASPRQIHDMADDDEVTH